MQALTQIDPAVPALSPAPASEQTIPVFARWFGSWQISLNRRALDGPQLRSAYDRAAPQWAGTLDRLGVPRAYEALLREVFAAGESEPVGPDAWVLDAGVGTGALSLALARVARCPFRLNAVDISPEMLARAGDALKAAGLAVSLRRADVRALPFADDTFDMVLAGHVLEHLPDPPAALAEMARVLKPGGLLIACLTRRSMLGAYIQLKWRTHRVSGREAARWLAGAGLTHIGSHRAEGHALSRQLSLACVGRKPDRAPIYKYA